MKSVPTRNGYALAIVLIFMILLLSLSSVAFRHIAAALRVESVHAEQVIRDQGSLNAVAQGLALLQTGPPPTNPFVGGVTIDTSSGQRDYTVTMSSVDEGTWTINAIPTPLGQSPDPMPGSFAIVP